MGLIKKYAASRLPGFLTVLLKESRYFLKSLKSRGLARKICGENSPIFLEIGAGDKKGENGWLTLDMSPACDIYWDLLKGLPFPDASVQKIYSSHVLEHFTFKENLGLLGECRRVLVPGGIFSVCVPNARLYAEAYVLGKKMDNNLFFGYKPAYNNISSIDCLNYTAYMDGLHKYMFDSDNLLGLLRMSGFRDVRLREFDASVDLKQRDFESIYAEARK